MELKRYITKLLQEHNCVIIPEFGGFIANYKSATIDHQSNRILPPSKSILFNAKLTTNDGLLGNSIVNQEKITYPEAIGFIAKEVDFWQKELNKGQRIDLGEIGFLFKDNERIVFEQSRELNLLLNAYGLGSVNFVDFSKKEKESNSEIKKEITPVISIAPSIAPKTTEEKSSEKETVQIVLEKDKAIAALDANNQKKSEEKIIPIQRKRRIKLRHIAVAAAIPFLFYSYWIPMETDFLDTGKIQMADFNPIHSSAQRVYHKREKSFEQSAEIKQTSWDELTNSLSDNVAVYNYQFDDNLYIPIKLDRSEKNPTENNEIDDYEETENNNFSYHVISGCFSVKENANQLVQDLNEKGYSAQILDFHKGLYRVSAGDYKNRSIAKERLAQFKSNGFSGWILKK